ncbi:MAG: hypothetical protein RL111_1866 [Pseudomonadota bacterium]|jgi:signal transduction histidine kinase
MRRTIGLPMLQALAKRLYARLWLVLIVVVAFITVSVGYVFSQFVESPMLEVVIRDLDGEFMGQGTARPHNPGDRMRLVSRNPGQAQVEKTLDARFPVGKYGPGPEFFVLLNNGQGQLIHLPQTPPSFLGMTINDLAWLLTLVAIAVALGTYPIVRWLTRRLERLETGVARWSHGDLSTRVDIAGDDEVASLARQFNHAAVQIESLVQSQRALLANASHELRTPLTRIRLGLELMGTSPSPERIDEIKRNIAELDELIGEILLSSRLDSVQAEVDTHELVDLTGLASEECVHAQLELDLGDHPKSHWVRGTPKLLHRLLRNLLENARKHAGGLGITVRLLPVDARWVSLQVSDRGPGIPQAYLERVFDPFFRLPDASDKEGAGLGLALVRSIAQRHGGMALCTQRPGGGVTFEVRLPLIQAEGDVQAVETTH